MIVVHGPTFAEVYRAVLSQLMNKPEYIAHPRGQETREILNCIIQIDDPTSNLFMNEVRSTPKRYLAGELFWYFSGDRSLDMISKYSGFWDKIKNPDGKTVNSAYGYLLFKDESIGLFGHEYMNEWQWALESLIKDKDSRQAIIRFNKPWHSWRGNKDFVCTLNGVFSIRDNKLNLTIIMRSQDEIFGRTFDVPFFTLLQQQMWRHLQPTYPDLKLGSYIQHNISTHIYERDFEKVENMLKHPFVPKSLPVLCKDLVSADGIFLEHRFSSSDDALINWIKENMK